jgi:hypothetical protein
VDNPMSEYGDLKIICAEDCGNAPKKELLKEFNIAFAKNDISFIIENITDHVSWNIAGEPLIQGKDNFAETLKQMKKSKAIELHISNIITHGTTGAANGILIYENKKNYAFCHVYIFSSAAKNAKLKEITSYVIEVS